MRFDTMPSRPILHACANTAGLSASMCSLSRRPGAALVRTEASVASAEPRRQWSFLRCCRRGQGLAFFDHKSRDGFHRRRAVVDAFVDFASLNEKRVSGLIGHRWFAFVVKRDDTFLDVDNHHPWAPGGRPLAHSLRAVGPPGIIGGKPGFPRRLVVTVGAYGVNRGGDRPPGAWHDP
jgi:hypothetical protein